MANSKVQGWARLSKKWSTLLKIQASDEPQNDSQWVCMVSDPIPTIYDDERRVIPTQIKSVKFSLESCDQGWGGPPEDTNTFRSSSSWFEASILRSGDDYSQSTLPTWIDDAIQGPVNISTFKGYDVIPAGLRSPYGTGNGRWLVQRNVQASQDVRHYEVVWPSSSSALEPEFDKNTGSGRGLHFVETLQAGDRIALFARARYSGWENHIHSVDMEIVYQT